MPAKRQRKNEKPGKSTGGNLNGWEVVGVVVTEVRVERTRGKFSSTRQSRHHKISGGIKIM